MLILFEMMTFQPVLENLGAREVGPERPTLAFPPPLLLPFFRVLDSKTTFNCLQFYKNKSMLIKWNEIRLNNNHQVLMIF